MLAVQGYYDGTVIKPFEKITAKTGQRVIITVMDDFIEPRELPAKKSMRGVLSKYANPALAKKEKEAWKNAVVEKYDNI